MTGADLITQERQKQIDKHGFTAEHHRREDHFYDNYQLQEAAHTILADELYEKAEIRTPQGWDESWFLNLASRSRKERLIIAGALIAAELDRIQ